MDGRITVGICTWGRASLTRTLTSLSQQSRKPDAILVADMDERPSTAGLCAWGREAYGLPITYRHVPGRNLAFARNACLDAAGTGRLAFIADDQTAPPVWLAALGRALTPGHAAVFGPIRGVYPAGAPDIVRMLDAHSRKPPRRGARLRSGEADNALLDLSSSAFDGLRFDPKLGETDGGDRDFFRRAWRRGARYVFGRDAFVQAHVPLEAASLEWLADREFRRGKAQFESFSTPRRRAALRVALEGSGFSSAARFAPGELARARARLGASRAEGFLSAAREAKRAR
ncbi:glycosyltransferase family 2 protein [Parvularcula dongshanensis]|nr:glycosyltransferase family A protein [Parvularcula dongshanensis]